MSSQSPTSPIEIYQELRELVITEAQNARTAYEQQLSTPVHERVLQGKCLESVKFQSKRPTNRLRFTCSENLSEFREGDFVVLHQGTPQEPIATAQWLTDGTYQNGGDYIELAVSNSAADAIDRGNGCYTVDAGYFDNSPQLLRALDAMGASHRGRERILPLLNPQTEVDGVDLYANEEAAHNAAEAGFDDSQEEAVATGSSCDWCSLIQGPPGTGKTRVLAQIVRERINRGQRILVTACTHRAIDEALNRVHSLNPDAERIAKVGIVGTSLLGNVPHKESFADCDFETSTEGYVIGATPYCAFSDHLRQAEFDCVIIDEASQMTLPLAVMAMLSADTYVVIGDEQQLPPVMLSKSSMQAQAYGLFQRLGSVALREMLTTSYRMNSEICQWISESFYMSDLEASAASASRRLQLSGERSTSWMQQALASQHSLVWIPTQTTKTRHYSMEEADLVNQLTQELRANGYPIKEIGVITPFRRQARTIRNRLRQNPHWDPAEIQEELVIDTVERMQGQEREIIIVSTAATDTGFISALQEFLYLPARLNVMVSRAKVKVIILASSSLLEIEGNSDEMNEAIEHWRSLHACSHTVEI